MDFWSRLIANTPLSSRTSAKDAARDPVKRRQRFEKEYSQLIQQWRTSGNLSKDVDAAENIEIRLQELTNILTDETRRPLPHPCISFCSTKGIFVTVAKIATSSYNEWIIKEAVLFFATLIESEEEAFVENDAFSASLTNLLVRITGANSIRLGAETEVRVVELAFNITTKIRLEPDILSAWFKTQPDQPSAHGDPHDQSDKFTGKTQKQDFPLFYLLIDYIHAEGKVGDFARTGLLYIIEAASNSVALEQWIVESDLSTLMATGLGALYSQLSRKLVVDFPTQKLPPTLAFSDYQHPESNYEIISSTSPDFQLHLDTFLSHLLFWQDVLNHCRSVEIKSTLLEHFQMIFLQQLLYPSLLESSDIDGGSSVAVLTYLRRILEALDHPDMINLILHYLLGLPDKEAATPSSAEPSVSAARKRKSMDLATLMATRVEPDYTPLLFNLVDLIQTCLGSRNSQTVCVTLQLVAAILKRHHRYAIVTLLHTHNIAGSGFRRTVGAHQQEVEYLMSLAGSVGGQDNFDEVYELILHDTMTRLESHPCSLKIIAPKTSTNTHKLAGIQDSLPGAPREVPPHTISPSDPLLGLLLDILETFFVNPVETNLSVTETILDMAVCGYVSLEGWLVRHPNRYAFDDEDPEDVPPPPSDPESDQAAEFEKLRAIHQCRRRPQWQASTLPRILTILESLTEHVSSFRSSVPRFEELVQQRREAFQTADSMLPDNRAPRATSKTDTPVRDPSSVDESRASSPARPGGLEGLAQRLFSELGTPTRQGSPRPPKGSQKASTPSKPLPAPPKEFPLNYDNPGRSGMAGSASPNPSSLGGRNSPVASQAAAFAAVDQGILARRVPLPTREVKPIPLSFEQKTPKDEPVVQDDTPADETGQSEISEQKDENADVGDDGQKAPEEQDKEVAGGPSEEEPSEEEPSGEGNKSEEKAEGEEAAGSVQPTESSTPAEMTASVSHIVTNVIVYQAFLMELASLVQVRAGLFNEVRFSE